MHSIEGEFDWHYCHHPLRYCQHIFLYLRRWHFAFLCQCSEHVGTGGTNTAHQLRCFKGTNDAEFAPSGSSSIYNHWRRGEYSLSLSTLKMVSGIPRALCIASVFDAWSSSLLPYFACWASSVSDSFRTHCLRWEFCHPRSVKGSAVYH